MKSLRMFLEYRTVDQIKFKCATTGKVIEPLYYIYDEQSLQNIVNKYKQNKEQFNDTSIFFAKPQGNSWSVKTSTNYTIDISRMSDKFLSSGTVDYSYDDIVSLLEDGDTMIVFVKLKN